MRPIALALFFLLTTSVRADAQSCPDTAPYATAREIIRDLERIAPPSGYRSHTRRKSAASSSDSMFAVMTKQIPSFSSFMAGPRRR